MKPNLIKTAFLIKAARHVLRSRRLYKQAAMNYTFGNGMRRAGNIAGATIDAASHTQELGDVANTFTTGDFLNQGATINDMVSEGNRFAGNKAVGSMTDAAGRTFNLGIGAYQGYNDAMQAGQDIKKIMQGKGDDKTWESAYDHAAGVYINGVGGTVAPPLLAYDWFAKNKRERGTPFANDVFMRWHHWANTDPKTGTDLGRSMWHPYNIGISGATLIGHPLLNAGRSIVGMGEDINEGVQNTGHAIGYAMEQPNIDAGNARLQSQIDNNNKENWEEEKKHGWGLYKDPAMQYRAQAVFNTGNRDQQWDAISTWPIYFRQGLMNRFHRLYGDKEFHYQLDRTPTPGTQTGQIPSVYNVPLLGGQTVADAVDEVHAGNPFYDPSPYASDRYYSRHNPFTLGNVTLEDVERAPTAPTVNVPTPASFNPAELQFRVNPRNY